MLLRRFRFKSVAIFLSIFVLLLSTVLYQAFPVSGQDKIPRDIIADDFLKNRANAKSRKPPKKSSYEPVTKLSQPLDPSRLHVGLTIWKLESVNAGHPGLQGDRFKWVPRRVESGAQFREGDSIRLSIESPRAGYLYVVNRDWLVDGTYGETNLIFPTKDENNRLEVAKLIDVPRLDQDPFTASPKPNQSGELLTFIVTSSPLPLTLSSKPLPISKTQLAEWERKWGGEALRFEMKGGAGQARTMEEDLAASPTGSRQLTREDPLPQTVYSLIPKNTDGLLFNLVLSYVR